MQGTDSTTSLDPDVFVAMGPYGPQEILPETGLGGFSASYDPHRGRLGVTLRVGVNFVSPVDEQGNATRSKFDTISEFVRRYPEVIPEYRWSEDGMAAYQAELEHLIEQTWGGRFAFSLPWAGWEEIRAAVEVDLEVTRTDRRLDGQHLFLEAVKLPIGTSLRDENLRANTQPNDRTRNDDQTMQLGSNDLQPGSDSYHIAVFYDHGDVMLDKEDQERVAWLAELTRSDPSFAGTDPFPAEVVGYASPEEGPSDATTSLSERRAQVVVAKLGALGFQGEVSGHGKGDRASTGDAELDRRATVTVGDGKGQTIALHEFGHAFGLGDEYPTKNGPIGAPASHDDLVRRMRDEAGQSLPGAIHEPNEGVMSLGDEIRPQHYATFFQALTDLTGIEDWRIGRSG